MLVKYLITLTTFLFLPLAVNSQDDYRENLQIVMQKCLELPVLENHLAKNQDILFLNVPVILSYEPMKEFDLKKNGKLVFFDDGASVTPDYNYDFTDINLKEREIKITFRHAPYFNTASLGRKKVGFRHWGTYFEITIEFRKQQKNNKWIIQQYTINDLKFPGKSVENCWVKKRYILLTVIEKEYRK